jgi:hypothetical protein
VIHQEPILVSFGGGRQQRRVSPRAVAGKCRTGGRRASRRRAGIACTSLAEVLHSTPNASSNSEKESCGHTGLSSTTPRRERCGAASGRSRELRTRRVHGIPVLQSTSSGASGWSYCRPKAKIAVGVLIPDASSTPAPMYTRPFATLGPLIAGKV